jgi:hypothetical protein
MAKKKITEEVEEAVEVEESAEAKEAAKAAAKAEKEAKKAAEKAAKEKEREEKKAAKEALRKNGELPPREGTKCALVWDTATAMSSEQGAAIDGKSLIAALPEINVHTVKTQYARWRKYHGISGRITAPKAEEEENTEAAE